ncbi:RHS repeat-associated core domain-containing protein [Paracoccus sp. DMF-8]|uniref:RHS repeat-associated core domain-containing protein n=1 Tax=Paracoccus sp. DMF-8 TaxID=3019445 RepID=UPI0023E41554|nr:RHS repeat-associated core domain-containing protein [Paracoccus sp. DMF-8]MDF3607598.1 RHS repeat-associated core domain-containing protein [Paracoccus sp. DMF-8]
MGWNARGQLARLETPEGEVWRYVYDAVGRRIQSLRIVSGDAGNKSPDDGHTVPDGKAYQWEGRRIVAESVIAADGTANWDMATSWVYETGSHAPLAQNASGELNYVVNDHIGTPRELVTQDGAAVIWRQDLDLWGDDQKAATRKYAANTDSAPGSCPIRFQGQWYDAESGLHYNNHRYYDPDAAQYLSSDPLRLLGGVRPQAYVANPNGYIDPLGLSACAYVDDNGTLNLRNKFADPNDPAYDPAKADEFDAFVQLWNEQAQASPNGFTRQRMTPQLTRDANRFRSRARRWLDERGMTDLAPGHLPDTAWGGLADPGDAGCRLIVMSTAISAA